MKPQTFWQMASRLDNFLPFNWAAVLVAAVLLGALWNINWCGSDGLGLGVWFVVRS